MQATARRPPRGVVYDSGFGESIDSVLALALLHGFESRNQARIAAITISNPDLRAAQLCDVVEKFYASAITGLAAIFFQGAPIGLAEGAASSESAPLVTGTLSKAAYTPRIQKMNDTAIAEVLIRNALTAQHDGNAVVVMDGRATNLARLLALQGTKELITAKVKSLVVVGGEFPNGKPDTNFSADLPAAKKVLAEWPTPVFCGRASGNDTLYPGASIETDYTYTAAHPVADAYRASHAMPWDAPTWAMMGVLYAVRPDDGYFKASEPGTVSLRSDGSQAFRPSPTGSHRYLTLNESEKERVVKTFTQLASAKPAPRGRRFQPMADEKEKAAAAEKNEKEVQ